MKKITCVVAFSAAFLFAGKSPFSMVRTVAWDANGQPSEEAVDLTVCLEQNPVQGSSDPAKSRERYENIIKYWADGLYEMSNGGNYLGNIRIFTGTTNSKGCDVRWRILNEWPRANVAGFNSPSGNLIVSDAWVSGDPDYEFRTNNAMQQFHFGMTLTHESMHYLYGLGDEYGTVSFIPDPSDFYNNVAVSANPTTDKIRIDVLSDNSYESSSLDALHNGQQIYFVPNGGSIPSGTWTAPTSSVWLANGYMTIDELEWAQDGSPSVSFSLRNPSGNKVNITSAGSGNWGVSLPGAAGATAHTIQNTQWPLGYFKFGACGSGAAIPWQWANLSTKFNFNTNSMQGVIYKNAKGKSFSGWETVVSNPANDVIYKSWGGWNRFWFKSLINRAPKANDRYVTKTHYLNYNDNTGTWDASHATWRQAGYCNTKDVELPYMKVELAGKTEAQYIKETRKHLNIMWMDGVKTEIIVVLDHSGSMNSNQKMQQAQLASKYVATGFLGAGSGYSANNVSVGVFAFNQNVSEVYHLKSNPNKNDIYSAISGVSAGGTTAMFDAIGTALNAFTSNQASLKMLYVISDGLDNASKNMNSKKVIDLSKSKNVAIHTFAYGADADKNVLALMAAETGGTFFDQQENLVLNANAATASVFANTVGVEQIAAAVLNKSATSSNIYVPRKVGRVRIYGSYTGSAQSNPIVVKSSNGSNLTFSKETFTLNNVNYFIADVDSAVLQNNSTSMIKIKNNMSSQKLDFRTLAFEKRATYGMSIGMKPEAPYKWPEQASFTASVSGKDGILAGVAATGKLTAPNGTTSQFNLYDDGTHGDALAGDGIYFGYLPNIMSNGSYQWEVSISNKQKKAYTVKRGTSLPDSIAFVKKTDTNPFEVIRNGQFVVSNCCTEDDVTTIQPEVSVAGFLQQGADEDKFKIVGTKSSKNYSLVLQSANLSSIEKVEVFDQRDMNTPLYSANVVANTSGRNVFSLSSTLAAPGNIIVVSGTHSAGASYNLLLLETEGASLEIGRFENIADWHSDNSTIALDGNIKSEGSYSLSTVSGWKIIESRSVSTADMKVIGDKMSLNLYVPGSSQNQYWLGTVELWINVPSANKRIQLGKNATIQSSFNAWTTYEFTVPQQAMTLLSEMHSDVRFQIVLNSADSIWVDDLRFSGNLIENDVETIDLQCPGQPGCSSSNPIRLSVDGSVVVSTTGTVWIEVVDFPQNWTPASVKISLYALDGAPLSGNLVYSNTTYPLSDWDFSKTFSYASGSRYVFKLTNLEGRPFRMNAWVSGQSMNLAFNGNYDVVF